MMRCLQLDPDKRPTVSELLDHSYLGIGDEEAERNMTDQANYHSLVSIVQSQTFKD